MRIRARFYFVIALAAAVCPFPWFGPTRAQAASTISFSAASYDIREGDGQASIMVTRAGDTTGEASVDYATSEGTASRRSDFDMGSFNRSMVLNNGTVFGTVNANRRHYAMAAQALARADGAWLSRLITRRVPLARFAEAFEHRPGDIKVVIDFAQA